MKVILIEDVQGAGKKGDTVTVRDGYGRNFLVPRGLAIPATQGNVARFENIIRSVSKKGARYPDSRRAQGQIAGGHACDQEESR